jgi:transposase
MSAVVIGVDPAKRSHAIEVIDEHERTLVAERFTNSSEGYREMRTVARRFRDRVWAVEGAKGVGAQLAQRLVADGEHVLDVPAKLSTRVRAMSTGHGRKTDPTDARAVAVVALRNPELHPVGVDDETVALRLLSERYRDLVHSRTQTVNRLHQLLAELVPAGAPKDLTVTKARAVLARVRPRDVAGKARRQLAADYIDDVATVDRKIKATKKRITEAIDATGTSVTEIVGVGPITAALILGEVGSVTRFPSNDHFASYTGTAPIDCSSGDIVRHRLSRAGNRQLNHALHVVAMAQRRFDPKAKAYYARKLAAGKGTMGAMRCLKRRISDAVFRKLADDQTTKVREGQLGATLTSSAADLIPIASTSDKPLPGLAADDTPVLAASS